MACGDRCPGGAGALRFHCHLSVVEGALGQRECFWDVSDARASSSSSSSSMTTLHAFTCDDLFHFNNVNLDPLIETYGIPFCLQYLAHWPEYFIVGYIMGKAEGSVAREEWHGHVTAPSVAPECRRLGLATKFMELLEGISEKCLTTNLQLSMVNSGREFGGTFNLKGKEHGNSNMRKALSRDTENKSIIPLPHPVRPEDIE